MVVIASDHRLLKVSWRGEPWWTARCRPFGQEDTGRCDEQVGIGLLKAVDSVCFDMFWPLGVTFPGWNLPVNALLVSKRWSNFQQVPWSSFFCTITMNHIESQWITADFWRICCWSWKTEKLVLWEAMKSSSAAVPHSRPRCEVCGDLGEDLERSEKPETHRTVGYELLI